MLKRFSAVLLFSLFSAQVFASALSQEDMPKSVSVIVDTQITLPKSMYYLGPDQGMGLLFGVIGAVAEAAATSAKEKPPGQVVSDFAIENKVLIENIVREETIAAFKKSNLAPITDEVEKSGATLKTEIKMYGLSRKTLFSPKLVSVLTVKYSLVDLTGKVLWEDSNRISPLSSPVEPTTLEDIKANPNTVLDGLWRQAAQTIAKKAFIMRDVAQ